MNKFFRCITLWFAISGLLTLPLHAQAIPDGAVNVESLIQLDKAAETTAAVIQKTLSGLTAGTRVKIADFYLNDAQTDLESYWRVQLAALLAEGAKYTILCTDVDDNVQADYVLRGNLFQTNDVLRIYTRLIRVDGSAIVKSWITDLARSDFIESITQIATGRGASVRRDRYENDSRTNPVALTLGGAALSRTIHDSSDNDWFTFTPEISGLLIAETSGSIDTYMYLYEGSSESELDTDDDDGSGSNARIEHSVRAGRTYFIRIRALDDETGAYSFSAHVEAPPADTLEPNDTKESASILSEKNDIQGVFGIENDIDWYKIEIPEGGSLLTVTTSGITDGKIEIYSGDELLGEEDDCDCGNTMRLTVKAPAGTAFVRLADQNGNIGTYSLSATLRPIPAPDSYEDDDRISGAKIIEVGDVQQRTFSGSDDIDWVKLVITKRGDYTIEVSDTTNNLDSAMRLYRDSDDDDDQIDSDDDSGSDYNPRIRTRLDAGTYFIRIRCLDSDPLEDNRYTLRVSAR
ncbi:MAG: hypothetical protein LBV68_00725 [Spirochaetaceae bacterium]|jgi:hypothetical protein|nr:hypothetical protein [Spirochaetaceae bacterium]